MPLRGSGRSDIDEQHLRLGDSHFDNNPVDLPMDVLFGKPPKMHRTAETRSYDLVPFDTSGIDIHDAVERVLRLPTVASKNFLITIGDRSVTGMVHRDQMVGPWQVPVADCAVTTAAYDSFAGEAMSMGERTPAALLDGPASGRMAIGESITNIAATRIEKLSDIKLSANWMCAAGHPGEDEKLYRTVEAVGMELCPQLGITIPVGKDSMSMRTAWNENGEDKSVTAPLSLVITAFAPVPDVRKTVTPQLRTEGDSELLLIDLGNGKNRLGASCLAQVYNQIGIDTPDVDSAEQLKAFFEQIQNLLEDEKILAYHDRGDGGLFTTIAEMAFAGHCGVDLNIEGLGENALAALFSEELGAVIQVNAADSTAIQQQLASAGLAVHAVGTLNDLDQVRVFEGDLMHYSHQRVHLQMAWSETSYRVQALRDNADCARSEFDSIASDDPGLSVNLSYDAQDDIVADLIANTPENQRPKVAILREQGVNGHVEMAAAFTKAGFAAVDVHMSDVLAGRVDLNDYKGLVACGGFSYGDVLGAGEGWAKSILFNADAREAFRQFFHREDTFSLGICNGCQMMSNLKELIPGSDHWPHFVRNQSEQFEARFSLVQVPESPSVLFKGMAGSYMPVAVAHGEGRAEFTDKGAFSHCDNSGLVSLRYIDNNLNTTERYPANPNGSPAGITGVCSADGRVTIMMPHPERIFRTVTNSWSPDGMGEDSPWMRIFRNARVFVR